VIFPGVARSDLVCSGFRCLLQLLPDQLCGLGLIISHRLLIGEAFGAQLRRAWRRRDYFSSFGSFFLFDTEGSD